MNRAGQILPRRVTPSTRRRQSQGGCAHARSGGTLFAGRFRHVDAANRFAGLVRAGYRLTPAQRTRSARRATPVSRRQSPLAAAISAGTKSDAIRCISGCVPGRQPHVELQHLRSAAVIINPHTGSP